MCLFYPYFFDADMIWVVESLSHKKARARLVDIVYAMAADGLRMKEAWASVAMVSTYRKIFKIRHTKSQTLNVSRLGMQLSLRNILKPSVKWRMKM